MNLLSAQDLSDINSSFTDIFDTFFKDEIKVSKKGPVFSRFSNFSSGQPNDITIRCMVVYGSGNDKDALNSDVSGVVDESDGYVLISYKDVDLAGLIENNKVTVLAGQDKIIVNGEEMKTTAIYPKANFAGDFVLLKVYFKKEL
jgi:hypothetical protein